MTMGSEMKCGRIIRGLTKVRLTIHCIGLYAATYHMFFWGEILHHQPHFLTLPSAMKMLHIFVDKCWQWLIVHAILCSVVVEEEREYGTGSTVSRRGGV